MKGFKKGFYSISSKKERKPEANLGQSYFTQPQPFSQQSQQPGEQQNSEEWQQTQKSTHVFTQMSEEKPRKQAKSVLLQEVSEFNPSGQMSMEQLIKIGQTSRKRLKSQERTTRSQLTQPSRRNRVKTYVLGKRSQRLLKHITKLEQLILKLASETDGTGQQTRQNRREIVNIQERLKRNWSFTNGNRSLKRAKTRKISKNQKEMFLLWKCLTSLSEVLEILIQIKKILDKRDFMK